MTIMPIDNYTLTQRRMQFIGNSVNKLTLKSNNIIYCQTTTTLLTALKLKIFCNKAYQGQNFTVI